MKVEMHAKKMKRKNKKYLNDCVENPEKCAIVCIFDNWKMCTKRYDDFCRKCYCYSEKKMV